MEAVSPGSRQAILITQCVQPDFVRPLGAGEPLPNLVHVGRLEAERLCGPAGSLVPFLERAHAVDPGKLAIIHVADRHDPVRDAEHFGLFRPHCVAGTPGAALLGPVESLAAGRQATHVVEAGDLNDFEDSDLARVLASVAGLDELQRIPIGVVGVWTDAKISFLLYDLATRLKARRLATCSALTASRSLAAHFRALDSMETLLGVSVFHAPESFLLWLCPDAPPPPVASPTGRVAVRAPIPAGWEPPRVAERDALVEALVPAGQELTPLGGGFSGAQVFLGGTDAAPFVVKVGPRDEIAKERFGNERVRRVLGDVVPRLMAWREGRTLGAMKVALAGGDGDGDKPMTFKRLYEADASEAATALLEEALHAALHAALGRMYRVAEKDNVDLLEAYGFVDRRGRCGFAGAVAERSRAIARAAGHADVAALVSACGLSGPCLIPEELYGAWLPGKTLVRETLSSLVHGDLNLANILVRRDRGALDGLWVIDFARLGRLPSLTDFAKVENDLAYILHRVDDDAAFQGALRLQEARLASPTLPVPELPALATTPAEVRHATLVRRLREIAAHVDDRGTEAMEEYRVALLRYAAHTLGFDEPSPRQLTLALLGCCRLGGLMAAAAGG